MACNDFVCPEECETLPDVDFSICNPSFVLATITDIFLTSIGHPLTDADANEWGTRLAYTSEDVSRILQLRVIGDKPAAAHNESARAYGGESYANKIHSLPFVIRQCNDTNYLMMRYYERARKGLIWYKSGGGKMYGGKSGIEAKIILDQVIPEITSELEQIKGVISFTSIYHPCRTDSVV